MAAAKGRGAVSLVLAILAAIALLGALVTEYASQALFDSDNFSNRAATALSDEAVDAEIGRRVTDDLILHAERDLVAARPILEEVVSGLVSSGAFQSLFRSAVRDVHRSIFSGDQNTVTLTLADLGAAIRGAVEALNPQLAKKIPGGTNVDVLESNPPDILVDLVQAAEDLEHLELVLLLAALIAGGLALWLAPDRRVALLRLGLAVAACGAVGAVAYSVGRSIGLDAIAQTQPRDAAAAIWDAYLNDLRTALLVLAGVGAVTAAAASSLLRPVDIQVPLRRAWELVATVPERRSRQALRGVLLLVAGIVVIAEHEWVIDFVFIAIGLYIAYAGASELMRLSTDVTPAPIAERARPWWRTGVIAGIAVVAVLGAGAFVSFGVATDDEDPATSGGCNGDAALCERSLDEIAIPATHNAMSAADNPGWLFAQQDRTIGDQLTDGIRGLLIDSHYGQKTESGAVKTDLSEIDSSEREAYAAELGEEALDAALRTRDRIVDSPTVEDRQIYLCHRFCELGAIPLEETLREIRNFVAANPNEVLVIVNEDYVSPEDFAAAVEKSGLIDYVYKGPVGPPWPTLEEMIDSGGRVLMLAETDAGDGSIPWYHLAYDELVQETPYSFKKPAALTEPKRLKASCKRNRGPEDASLFLINHWIDTSPAPKPSNAAKVNTREALSNRIAKCQRQRALDANLIAVDFYEEGDLFGVVDDLNRAR
ncbi:MAG TPA: hypothetical protein VHJ54_10655 [Solirubrobacterales bacterium]|nr:hypothetical protein [Solirubrobacterales bacterium]